MPQARLRMFAGNNRGGWDMFEDQQAPTSGAARGQSGGGSRAGSSRSVFEQYQHLTPEQKRQKAKQRRLAKK